MSLECTQVFLCLPPTADPLLQFVLPLEESIGKQHHSSVISMETSFSRGSHWAPSQSLPFCDRPTRAALPTPSSRQHSPSSTHIFPFVFFLHLKRCRSQDGINPVASRRTGGERLFLTRPPVRMDSAGESTCHPHLSPLRDRGLQDRPVS